MRYFPGPPLDAEKGLDLGARGHRGDGAALADAEEAKSAKPKTITLAERNTKIIKSLNVD